MKTDGIATFSTLAAAEKFIGDCRGGGFNAGLLKYKKLRNKVCTQVGWQVMWWMKRMP